MILAILSFIAGLVTGLLVMRKHSARASELEAKGRAALDALKGR
jgi:type II secretory pathway pseudopilin PulG